MASVHLVFLSDSHLGIDQPAQPRIARRRRGDDFMANYQLALDYAATSHCDAVVHGGDIFFRSRVRPELVQAAFIPLKKLADAGVPVFVVPGNHERSRVPHAMLALHPGIHIFDRPRTYIATLKGCRIAFAGFPYTRLARHAFPKLLAQTGWSTVRADARFLCVHQCFEGATVGPGNYTFRTADDVVRHEDVPGSFDAVLSGHIHRYQVLGRDLRARNLVTPVFYSGSIERTSFAESEEPKGFLDMTVQPGKEDGATVVSSFRQLPTRPMLTKTVYLDLPPSDFRQHLARILGEAPADAILRLQVRGRCEGTNAGLLSATTLRAMSGPRMTVEVRPQKTGQRLNVPADSSAFTGG